MKYQTVTHIHAYSSNISCKNYSSATGCDITHHFAARENVYACELQRPKKWPIYSCSTMSLFDGISFYIVVDYI